MIRLTSDECRILGVLVEKAQTTPAQYPLTLNALMAGANQKSNRNPVLELGDERALNALDSLRGKGLVREVMLSGSRVEKFRHTAREALEVSTAELVVLAELMLRGPQTAGELRSRASRMHPLESMDVVTNVLEHLGGRPEPYVRRLSPAPGSRAARYGQLLCPDLHRLEAAAPPASPTEAATAGGEAGDAFLTRRVEALEAEVKEVKGAIGRLEARLGETGGPPRTGPSAAE
jgi:uncharacterized protein YceH (UPF0502 family)